MKPHRHSCLATFLVVLLLGGPPGFAEPKPKGALIDLTKSKPDKTNNDYNLGPTGALGWMYVESGMTEEARQILITKVEKGSPADGKLQEGDVIVGVFGQPFTTDARRTFGLAIGRAEAADGMLPLTVWRKDKTETVSLKLQVMGAYSETSPYNCPKAKKILEQGLAVIAKNIGKDARFHINERALLASGQPEYLDIVRKRAQEVAAGTPDGEALWSKSNHGGMHAWGHGYSNLFLCEYYLATGDKSVLPAIRSYTTTIARGQGHFGTWGHGYVPPMKDGKLHGLVPPYGPVNASGLPCFVSIILALKCGLEDPELLPAIDRANQFFGYYSGKGSIPYGELRKRAIPALDTLAALLNDDDRWLRVQTSEALRTIGSDAKAVLPQMLKAATVKDATDQMQFGVGALAYALFYPGGAYGPKGILADKDSFTAIPKAQIYPVIKMVAVNPDSAARGCLKSAYANFTLQDMQALAPEVVTSINEMATANAMFSKGIRLAGIQAMARLKIEEGIPLTIMMMSLPDWGKAYIRAESLKVLKEYRGAAKSVVPDFKKIADESPKEKAAVMEVVGIIESDTNPPKLISLKEHLKKQRPVGQK